MPQNILKIQNSNTVIGRAYEFTVGADALMDVKGATESAISKIPSNGMIDNSSKNKPVLNIPKAMVLPKSIFSPTKLEPQIDNSKFEAIKQFIQKQ